ncbi:MAG: hypothetical protein ABW098_11250 [Candidatus Thiodiazotropha sp.]
MFIVKGFSVFVLIFFCMPVLSVQAQTESIEIVDQYIQHLNNKEWLKAASLHRKTDLLELQPLLNSIILKGEENDVGSLTPEKTYANFLKIINDSDKAYKSSADPMVKYTILGEVSESPNLRHVIYRQTIRLNKRYVDVVNLISTINNQGKWRVALSKELHNYLSSMEEIKTDNENKTEIEKNKREKSQPRNILNFPIPECIVDYVCPSALQDCINDWELLDKKRKRYLSLTRDGQSISDNAIKAYKKEKTKHLCRVELGYTTSSEYRCSGL